MPIYDFDPHQEFSSIDKMPDHRSDDERFNSPLSLYNHQSADIAYAERMADELINLSGAWITVYGRKHNEANRDDVWDEDADPTYGKGTRLKGKFIPAPAEITLTKWGVDVPNQTTIHFSRTNVLKLFGKRMIAEGDVLVVPHNTLTVTQSTDMRDGVDNRIDRYRVIKSSDVGNFKYRWLYWACLVQAITGDQTIDVEFSKESA